MKLQRELYNRDAQAAAKDNGMDLCGEALYIECDAADDTEPEIAESKRINYKKFIKSQFSV